MSKIKIKWSINSVNSKSNKNYTNGIINNNMITYKDNTCLVNLFIENNIVKLRRECDEFNQELIFELDNNHMSSYYIKDMNLEVKLETLTNKLNIKDNKISIEYDLYMNDEFSDTFRYIIEWEKI